MEQNAEWPLNCSKAVGTGGKGDLGADWILVIIPQGAKEQMWLLKVEFCFSNAGKPYLPSEGESSHSMELSGLSSG